MPVPLPASLRDRLKELAAASSAAELLVSARAHAAAQRDGISYSFKTEEDCLAYALTRMPAMIGAISTALGELPAPPKRLLDLHAGPGGAAWAVQARWGNLPQVTLVEEDSGLVALGRRLGTPATRWMVDDPARMDLPSGHDLVLLAYSSAKTLTSALIDRAWQATGRYLVVIDPDFAKLREVRTRLAAYTIAPCPHRNACPVPAGDSCNFAARVERSREHRQLKGGDLTYEDEKFSYFVFDRQAAANVARARIVRRPCVQKGRVELRLCTLAGLEKRLVVRSDPAWKAARKADWGQRWTE